MSRHQQHFDALRASVLEAPGALDPALRRAAFAGEPLPVGLDEWARHVRDRAATIEDADMAALRAAGLSEDAAFELTVCVAVGAADARLRAARRALGREQ